MGRREKEADERRRPGRTKKLPAKLPAQPGGRSLADPDSALSSQQALIDSH